MSSESLLDIKGLSKSFPGVKALDGISFSVKAGEVHALLGENGAGKSTLIKVLTGVYSRDAGQVQFNGDPFLAHNARHAQELGVSTVYQEVNLLPNMSVAENIFLGREPRRFGFIQYAVMQRDAEKLLQRFQLDIDVKQDLGSYSVAVQQMVAIARAMAFNAKLLILDEPTASLDQDEVERLFELIQELKRSGVAIIFVSHFLDQVYRICDRMTVLRNGRYIASYDCDSCPRSSLVEAMLGKQFEETAASQFSAQADAQLEAVLSAENISRSPRIEKASLVLFSGESVGLAGLLGAGRSELCRLLFGLDRVSAGSIKFEGQTLSLRRPIDAIKKGIALCPEDRKSEGIFAEQSLRENVVIAEQVRRGVFKKISKQEQRRLAESAVQDLAIATSSIEKRVGELSGGNQQKVILARWLITNPKLLLLDEPTRGIDVGAHAEVIALIERLRLAGMSLLVCSSEIEELVKFSQRVAIMREGKLTQVLSGASVQERSIMNAIAGA
jgi:monosaccharide-transporting ATPase